MKLGSRAGLFNLGTVDTWARKFLGTRVDAERLAASTLLLLDASHLSWTRTTALESTAWPGVCYLICKCLSFFIYELGTK